MICVLLLEYNSILQILNRMYYLMNFLQISQIDSPPPELYIRVNV